VLVRSEDQEEELISSVYVTGLKAGGTSRGEKLIVGGGSGVLTLWEKGAWDDQDERIIVGRGLDGGESLEVLTVVPDDLARAKTVAVGQADGVVQFVQLGSNKVISKVMHDELEGVVGLGFDIGGRMVSGGGSIVKVWHEAVSGGEEDDEGEENAELSGKRTLGNEVDDSENDARKGSDNVEKKGKRKRKKRKKGRENGRGGVPQVTAFNGLG
jgi:hypothetical protein